MKDFWKPLAVVALGVLSLLWYCHPPLPFGGRSRPGPVPAEMTPKQTATLAAPIHRGGSGGEFTITPLAHYQVYAEVMGTEHYHFDWTSTLAPLDLCLVWGGLTPPKILSQLKIRQGFRWCFWEYGENFPYDNTYIGRNMANTHIIPADSSIASAVGRVRVGDWVELEGELVRVDGQIAGGTVFWNSSLSREDTGDGACEVMYLTSIHLRGKEWRAELPQKPAGAP